jgi:hypothetical protein
MFKPHANLVAWLAAIALFGSGIGQVNAKPTRQKASKGSNCNFGAWSSDTDLAGLNVRSGPSVHAAIIGKLPPPESGEESGADSKFATEFHIAEARNGWFRIENPRRWAQGMSLTPEKFPPLPSGWISGKKIYVTVYSGTGFSAPDVIKSKILWSGDWADLQNAMTGMTDCKGEWVKATYTTPKGIKSAWFRGVCAIQETTCGGAVDQAEEVDRLRKR